MRIFLSSFSLAVLFLSFACPPLRAQSDTARGPAVHYGVVGGYHGFGYHYAEVGVARVVTHGGYGAASWSTGVGASAELRIGGGTLLGFVASTWINAPLALGLGLGYYTTLHGESTLRLRPEIGFRLGGGARITYGYSIVLSGDGFNGVNRHDFGFRIFFPVH